MKEKEQRAVTTICVNDGEVGNGPFQFEFGPNWVHECNYPERFYGGDEHWTTSVQFGDEYPWFKFRFEGESVTLYGHKVPMGGMADVYIDGESAGHINFYSPERIEKTPLWQSGTISFGMHTVTVQLIPESDLMAGDTHEAAVDYAETVTDSFLPVKSIGIEKKKLLTEKGLVCSFGYMLLPTYANETVNVSAITSNEAIASVIIADGRCSITANGIGNAIITLQTNTGIHNEISVTVRESVIGRLSGTVGSVGRHARQDMYWSRLENWNSDETKLACILWKNDEASLKLELITGSESVTNVKIMATEWEGDETPDIDVRCTFVTDTLAHDTGHMIPDVISPYDETEIPAQHLATGWIAVKTGKEVKAGQYTANIKVTDAQGDCLIFPLTVSVIGLTLPDSRPEMEIWQYPYSSNRYYSGMTSDEYFPNGRIGMFETRMVTDGRMGEALRSQIALFRRAGGRSVTTTVVEDPWNSQTPDPYPSMIKWYRETDGRFTFSYDDFDAWISFNESDGVNGRILCFSMSGWGSGITYLDKATCEVITECPEPNTAYWADVWTQFLKDLMVHTEEKGWFHRIYLAMDERPAPMVEGVLDLIDTVRNERGECFHTALAVYTFDTEYLFDRITDLALAYHMDMNRIEPIIKRRKESDKITTLYTCGPQYNALENQPYEGQYTLWFCDRMGSDGFLRWAQDAFNDDPLRSAYHWAFAAGDIYLYYPDEKNAVHPRTRTSVRFEMLTESARDVAKVRYLRDVAPEFVKELDAYEQTLTNHGNLEYAVNELKRLLNEAAYAFSLIK